MKYILIIILMMTLTYFNLFSANIEPDKAWHFTGCAGLYILADCVAEWVDLPDYVPFLFVGAVAVGKELSDPYFNWQDIKYDALGIGFGFMVRW